MKTATMKTLFAAQVILAVGLVVASTGCSMPDSAVYADRGETTDETVLAIVGEAQVTEAEVSELMSSQLMKVEQERYELLKQGLDRLVADRLVEMEAKKLGITKEELFAQEVEAKVDQPTQDEIDAFYEERKARIKKPKEEVEGQIRDYLLQQRQAVVNESFVAGLKKSYGYQLLLEPIRIDVASEGFPAKGPEGAPVTIVEFSDFECPYCARVNPALDQVVKKYGDKVRLVFRQFPLNIHANAQKAAEASLCARDQGKFWEMHDAMFKEQRSLGVEQLKEKAARLDLDAETFNECLDSSRYAEAVVADLQAGSAVGVTGTPAFFINGRFISGAQPYADIAKLIDEELAMQKKGS
jgi:protein-disulfide isomerase